VKSRTTRGFRDCFEELPPAIQRQARDAFRFFQENPQHPGLRFKKVHGFENVFSVRISRGYRALGTLESDTLVWFWIGSHDEYDRLIP
jgi:hypothetical protein